MTINKDLPFDLCENCDQFVLDVNEQVLFGDGQFLTRTLNVGCKNAWLCKQLAERHGIKDDKGTQD